MRFRFYSVSISCYLFLTGFYWFGVAMAQDDDLDAAAGEIVESLNDAADASEASDFEDGDPSAIVEPDENSEEAIEAELSPVEESGESADFDDRSSDDDDVQPSTEVDDQTNHSMNSTVVDGGRDDGSVNEESSSEVPVRSPTPVREVREEDAFAPELPQTGPRIRSAKHLYDTGAENRVSAYRDPHMFGPYRIHLGAAKPTFSDQDAYDDFYGSSAIYPTFGVDYFFFDWYATLGITMRAGFYKDDGNAANVNDGGLVENEDSPTELTLLPLQLGGTFQVTPFSQKWVVLSGWGGLEYLYFEEVRLQESSGDSSEASEESSEGESETDSDEDDKPYVTSGKKYSTFFGGAVHLMLNALDPKGAESMRVMGLRAIYLSPYFQTVNSLGSGVDFSRTELGLAFTFESI